jgi:outer membrane murein-binding lipoprotein Lpp
MTFETKRECYRHATAAEDRALGLAVRVAALADEIDALHRDIRAARDEPVRRAGFRCDTAAGWLRQASAELAETR